MTRDDAIRRIEAALDQQLHRFESALADKVRDGALDVDSAADAYAAAVAQQAYARRVAIEALDDFAAG